MENKEIINIKEREGGGEKAVIKDVGESSRETIPREIKSWMEKVEEEPVAINDQQGQPLLKPSTPQTVLIQLPVTRKGFVAGFKKRMDDAGRWLSEFVFRIVKKNDGKVKFKEE